ncbi:MAG: hypothetical protein BGO49_02795 [Planctomycetales bacterium 71-10]|nr:MAG: hypothetical protein BGO49_02795 [Planctomycetales bacterium 71-10]
MIKVDAPRFDLDECKNASEREFIELLHARAEAGGWFADSWPREDRFILSVCPSDPRYNCVLRTLRVDFDRVTASFGPDETHQFATDLDPARADVVALSGRSPAELASAAATWLEKETRRPIVRHEWDRPTFRRREWFLEDTGEGLGFSDSADIGRRHGLGPPDRVVRLDGRGESPEAPGIAEGTASSEDLRP